MKSLGIYIHIPFCKSRCYYCDFISSVLKEESCLEKYVQYITKEIELVGLKPEFKEYAVDTIYIGGGTPSLLKSDYFRIILEILCLKFNVKAEEVTIEANPSSLVEQELKAYKSYGLNRLSIGVQSLNNKTLKAIGRLHDRDEALAAVKLACDEKLNVSTDLMLGLPYQTKNDIKDYVDSILQYDVKHISTYMLSLEKNTPLEKMVLNNEITISNDDGKVELFNYASKLLEERGFKRYEVSNFAVPGFESKHNLRYWQMKDYLGLGVSAHSLIGNKRFYNPSNFDDYYSSLDQNNLAYELEENLSNNDLREEYIMLGFRTLSGINIDDYNKTFNKDFVNDYKSIIDKYKKFLNISNKSISIKEEYLNVMNSIVINFMK